MKNHVILGSVGALFLCGALYAVTGGRQISIQGTFLQSGSGATLRTIESKERDIVSVKDFGAVGDGVADEGTKIQAAIDSIGASGGSVYLPPGTYKIASSLTITTHGVHLVGAAGAGFGGASNTGAMLSYSGTGAAIDVGDGTNPIFHTGIKGIQIVTTGAAVASVTAIGIRCRNCRYSIFDEIVIGGSGTGFQGGAGLEFRATASSFDATNEVYNPRLFDNFYGIHMIGAAAPNGANDLKVFGGFIIGHSPVPAGSVGMYGDQFSDSMKVYGTDVETYENGFLFGGTNSSNHTLMASRSEFPTQNHVKILASAAGIQILGHQPESPGWGGGGTCGTPCFSDAGTQTIRLDRYGYAGRGLTITPSTNTTEVLSVNKADATAIFDVSTNGTPRLELVNGANLTMFSDSFTTQKFNVQGSNGAVTIGSTNNAGLGAATNGTMMYCTDCTLANPCAGAGTGALAKRIAGAWICN